MTTLTVNTSHDFSTEQLSNVTLLDFTNVPISTAVATFAASQFQEGQLLADLQVNGSSAFNGIVVNGGSVDASHWSFFGWGILDSSTFNGSAGDDTIVGSRQRDTINGGGGGDTISGGGGTNHLNGGQGDDHIVSNSNAIADIINGDGGTDFALIDRTASTATFSFNLGGGGSGLDIGDGTTLSSIEHFQFAGGIQNDTVTGGALDDILNGQGGDDVLNGAGGHDLLFANDGFDTLNGGGGDDDLSVGPAAGHTIVNGGAGIDQVILDRRDSTLNFSIDVADGGGGRDTGDGTTVTNTERVHFIGGSGDDTASGGAFFDVFQGRGGNDTLNGRGEHDFFFYVFGDGADAMDGGAGNDNIFIDVSDDTSGTYTINVSDGGGGRDIGNGTTLTRIEQLGFDGGGGVDKATGGALADNLRGFGGDDILKGGGGDDEIAGGNGSDTLTGGAGADTFFYGALTESAPRAQRDLITDFVSGTDTVDLSNAGGGHIIDFIGSAAFGHHAGEMRVDTTATQTIISWDTNGDGLANFRVAFSGVLALTAADFTI